MFSGTLPYWSASDELVPVKSKLVATATLVLKKLIPLKRCSGV